MAEQSIITHVQDDVLTVTLNRPEVRNAQTPQMWEQLAQIANTVPEHVRFVLLAGAGVDFSAGLDRAVFADTSSDGMIASLQLNPDAFIQRAQEAFKAWTQIPQIVVAAVQGNVIGAGFQLALASDIMVAAPDARFALRETSIGLIPDLGGTGALIDALGYRRAFALCAMGDFLPADSAHAMGLVHSIGDDPQALAADVIAQLRPINPGAVTDVKALLRQVATDLDSWDEERSVQIRRLTDLFGGSPS